MVWIRSEGEMVVGGRSSRRRRRRSFAAGTVERKGEWVGKKKRGRMAAVCASGVCVWCACTSNHRGSGGDGGGGEKRGRGEREREREREIWGGERCLSEEDAAGVLSGR